MGLFALIFVPLLAACSGGTDSAGSRGESGDDRNNDSQEMFSEAEAYERFMGRWSRQLAPLLIEFADPEQRSTILDAGSGTGALALAINRRFPTAKVVGIDPSQVYVEYAIAENLGPLLHFEVGDAQQLRRYAVPFGCQFHSRAAESR
jgi:ubiquinone/menaquinone biosynthesis C-methylase UbiE